MTGKKNKRKDNSNRNSRDKAGSSSLRSSE
jgi:hypothetical protein